MAAPLPASVSRWRDGRLLAVNDAWLALRGLRTLPLRYAEQARSALAVARWLQARPEVADILYPALPGAPGHDLWRRDYAGREFAWSLFLLAGPEGRTEQAVLKPIMVNAQLVGYLGYVPRLQIVASLERVFLAQQTRTFAAIALGMLAAVLLNAALIARWLAGRLRVLGEGTAAVAQGDYSVRLPARGHDELAQLADCDAILLVCPAQALRVVAHDLPGSGPVVICAKGIEKQSSRLLTDVLEAAWKHVGKKGKAAGIDCVTTGSSALWPVAGIFDYVSMRTNGYQFHSDLAAGKISWTSPEVGAVFDNLGKLQPYVTANHAAIDWQDAAALLVQGKAANYVMGNFAVGVFKEGGMTNDNLGFMVFPEITPGIARAEEAPTDTIHLTSGAKNPEDAKTFLAYMASPEAQSKWNAAVGQLPTNKNATVDPADPFLTAGFQALSTATGGIAQFWDRDADAEYAKAGMEGFQRFLVQPEALEEILAQLEATRTRLFPQ